MKKDGEDKGSSPPMQYRHETYSSSGHCTIELAINLLKICERIEAEMCFMLALGNLLWEHLSP